MPNKRTYLPIPFATGPVVFQTPGFFNPNGIFIGVTPGSGGTIKVEYKVTSSSEWKLWPAGVVSEYTEDTLLIAIESLRITATISNGLAEIVF